MTNDGSNNDYPEQRWVPKLVVNKAYVSESLIKEKNDALKKIIHLKA